MIAISGDAYMSRRKNIVCLLLAALMLAGCAASTSMQSDPDAVSLASYAAVRPARLSDGPYTLGPGDRLRVKAYSDPDLTGEYEVGSSGFVSIPLVGQVRASGLTTRQLEQSIIGKMKGKLAQEPKINIEIAAYAPFYVYGEVKKAGEYPFHPGITVADAVAVAGGLTYRANEDRVFLRRAGSSVEQMVTLAVPVRVYPGDNIRIAERFF